jgi:hypothetical protein
MNREAVEDLTLRHSGLLGVSGISSAMTRPTESNIIAPPKLLISSCFGIARESRPCRRPSKVWTPWSLRRHRRARPEIRRRVCEKLAWVGNGMNVKRKTNNDHFRIPRRQHIAGFVIPTARRMGDRQSYARIVFLNISPAGIR